MFNILKQINGQEYWAIAMIGSSLMYVLISLLGRRRQFNLDKLLHRGAVCHRRGSARDRRDRPQVALASAWAGSSPRGIGSSTWRNYVWTFAWFAVFVVGTIYNLTHEVSDGAWMNFWKIQLGINISLAVVTVIWFTTGGFLDLRRMIARLKTRTRDHSDDGFVRHRIEEGDPAAKS